VPVVRCKLYTPGDDNRGTGWQEVKVDKYGVGQVIFNAHKPSTWTKFRVATLSNDRVIQENFVNPTDNQQPWAGAVGIEVEPGDVVTIDFVVHEFAFRARLNDDMDDEDEMTLNLVRLHRKLNRNRLNSDRDDCQADEDRRAPGD